MRMVTPRSYRETSSLSAAGSPRLIRATSSSAPTGEPSSRAVAVRLVTRLAVHAARPLRAPAREVASISIRTRGTSQPLHPLHSGAAAAPGSWAMEKRDIDRLFVIGGTGFIGVETIREAIARGWEVRALVRSDGKAEQVRALGATPIRGDAGAPDEWMEA